MIPALVIPFVVDPQFDFMLRTLSIRLETQRLIVVVACVIIACLAVVLVGVMTGQPVDVGIRNVLGGLALSLVVATVIVGDIAALLLFVATLVVWVFGREPLTGQPYTWAVLLEPATWQQLVGAGLMCCLAALLWAREGSRGGRR